MKDKWSWRCHSSNCYTVSSAYQLLTEIVDHDVVVIDYNDYHFFFGTNNDYHFILWLKEMPLKVSLFATKLNCY